MIIATGVECWGSGCLVSVSSLAGVAGCWGEEGWWQGVDPYADADYDEWAFRESKEWAEAREKEEHAVYPPCPACSQTHGCYCV